MNVLALLFAGEKVGDVLEEQVRELTKPRKLAHLRKKRGLALQNYNLTPPMAMLVDAERKARLEAMGAWELVKDMMEDGEFLQKGREG